MGFLNRATSLLFVTGCHRSGTSLLYACLNQHPDIGIMYETEMLSVNLPPKLRFRHRWLENANAWGKFLGRHQLPSQPSEAALLFKRPDDIYRHFAARKQARYGGEKSPTLMTRLGTLFASYPECKLITIFRHPADVQASVLQAGKGEAFFAKRGWLERQIYSQETMFQNAFALRQKGLEILHITYEELTKDPEATSRRICGYLLLPFDRRMTTIEGADLSAVYNTEHHRKVRSGKIAVGEPRRVAGTPSEHDAMLEMLWQRWCRMHEALAADEHSKVFSEPLPPGAARLMERGRRIIRMRALKRCIYHMLPAEAIRLFRAVKLMVNESREADGEIFTPAQLRKNRIAALLAVVVLVALGAETLILWGGAMSPLVFFMLAPISVGWLAGIGCAILSAASTAVVWTVSTSLVMPETSLGIMAWNLLARFVLLFLLGFFSRHLKSVLLRFQKNPY
ncbi:MAG: sulfotransferase [Verrucomicrobiae bacterium]